MTEWARLLVLVIPNVFRDLGFELLKDSRDGIKTGCADREGY
jgi:hypothetical protein